MAKATLFVNGRIFQSPSSRDAATFGSCMLVSEGQIVHVGAVSDAAIQSWPSGWDEHDLGGQTVLPGFIDAHMHFLMLGQSLQKAPLEGCRSLEDIRAAISAHAAAHPTAPRLLGRGWMHSMTPEGVTAAMLDDLDAPRHRPIYIDSKDLHSTWCSTAALDEMGLLARKTPESVQMVGGRIHWDAATGRPSGLLEEAAVFDFVWPHLARIASVEERAAAIGAAVDAYAAAGYTGVVDMAMDEGGLEALQHFVKTRAQPLPLDVAAYWLIKPRDSEAGRLAQVDRAIELARQFDQPPLRIVGVKVVCDGIIDACTAALTEPYDDPARTATTPVWTRDQLQPVVDRASAAGLQTALHAIGDATVTLVLDVLEAAGPAAAARRPRVEHLELTTARDVARLGRLGITASIQPVHLDPAIVRAWPRLLGDHRCGRAFAYREFADAHAPLALGTDAPTAPHGPLANVYVATTRRSAREPANPDAFNPHFALGLAEALAAHAAGGARSVFADAWTGTLAPGKHANFVVVDMAWDPAALLQARVHQTWVRGQLVFDRPPESVRTVD